MGPYQPGPLHSGGGARSPGPTLIPAPTLDNTKIAFVSNQDDNWEIYVMDADGSNLMNLTNHSETFLSDWSPA